MQLGGGADADGVQAVDGEQVLPLLEQLRHLELGAETLQGVRLEPGQRDHFDIGQLRERFQRGPAGKAETDDSDA